MTLSAVVAVISAYNPGDSLLASAGAVAAQVDGVIVVDDGSTDDVSAVLAQCRALGYTVIESAANSGIAHALNVGVAEALGRGADAVLTLDQDTVVCSDYVERAKAHAALADSLDIDLYMLSSEQLNYLVAPFWFAHRGLTLAFEPLQSGLVIPKALFDAIGMFDEGLFIDCVETEFYLRARAAGGHALVIPGTNMDHEMGSPARWVMPRPFRWLAAGGGVFDFREDAAFRNYYIMRNRITLYRRYARSEPLWAFVSLGKEWLGRVQATLFGNYRLARIYLTAAGFRDARRGITGRIPEGTLRRSRRLG